MTKSGRVTNVSTDGKAGVVRDADGIEYPFTAERRAVPGEVAMFDVADRLVGHDDDGKEVRANFAKLLDD